MKGVCADLIPDRFRVFTGDGGIPIFVRPWIAGIIRRAFAPILIVVVVDAERSVCS